MTAKTDPISVTQFTRLIKDALESSLPFQIRVKGELSNVTKHSSGHVYFTLKDSGSQLRGVLWRGQASKLTFNPKEGLAVVAAGKVNVYEPRGEYNLVCSTLELEGAGDLFAKFEKLKAKLMAEGLFDENRKRPLPPLPSLVGVVTSPTGAAFRDILKVMLRRYPNIQVVLYPALVQGEGAAQDVAQGIQTFNKKYGSDMDLMIVGRGGGSIEDLWAFNEEAVARAIHASRIPVISAVGHEVDFTIADFVADLRAPTPSAAAELAVPMKRDLLGQLGNLSDTLKRGLLSRYETDLERVRSIERSYGFRRPMDMIRDRQRRLDERLPAMREALKFKLRHSLDRLKIAGGRLEELSPLKVLGRGYSVTTDEKGTVIRDPKQTKPGQIILTRVLEGKILSMIQQEGTKPASPEAGGEAGRKKKPANQRNLEF